MAGITRSLCVEDLEPRVDLLAETRSFKYSTGACCPRGKIFDLAQTKFDVLRASPIGCLILRG
jgi:hypothetical protein